MILPLGEAILFDSLQKGDKRSLEIAKAIWKKLSNLCTLHANDVKVKTLKRPKTEFKQTPESNDCGPSVIETFDYIYRVFHENSTDCLKTKKSILLDGVKEAVSQKIN